jgi:acyl carrier protein
MIHPPAPEAVLAAVIRILEQVTRRPQPAAAMATALHALDGLDSLRLLETVALAEEHFGVMVDTGGLGQMETLGDIVRLVAAGRPG